MYVLRVFGGAYEDSCESHYYSNNLDKLKDRGMQELISDYEAAYYDIIEVNLAEDVIQDELKSNKICSVSVSQVENEVNFKRLLKLVEGKDEVVIKCEGRYFNDERAYNIEIIKMSNHRLVVNKVDKEEDEILDFEEYTISNCKGRFINEVLDDCHFCDWNYE